MEFLCLSFLDEFVQRKLVEDVEAFRQAYRDPDEFCCLFVIDVDFTRFVFLPLSGRLKNN